ncbi:MAG: GAF domain-containing protein [Armatimonadetes bacterium]|nr:GAF domain-containing protein [Armatimonadota bacterium]
MKDMPRPWYTYLLLFAGSLALLGAMARPLVGGARAAPGALVLGPERRLYVQPGSPLSRAGVLTGDRWVNGETLTVAGAPSRIGQWVQWSSGVPRAGWAEIIRQGKVLRLAVQPAAPAWPVHLAWWALALLQGGLVAVALALFWQQPRDGRAVLLGLVLISAPVFAFPRAPRLVALALAAHFFSIFPAAPRQKPQCPWRMAVAVYLPLFLFGLLGAGLVREGRTRAAAGLFDVIGIGYAIYGLAIVLAGWRRADEASRPIIRALTVAAGAILAAVLVGISQQMWAVPDQFAPVSLLPAALFGAAVAHLVFRLRALEVRVVARRTLQYLLARWTLGTLFLLPGFLLVWRLGQISVTHARGRPAEMVPYLVWMFIVALLLGKRQEVLRDLDRRFFRDVDMTRQTLIRLAQNLGGQTDAKGVLRALEQGVRQALHPTLVRFVFPDGAPEKQAELAIPVSRGQEVWGTLQIGPRESGLPYTTEERQLLVAAAVQAAVALENARLSAALLERQRAELAARTAGVLAGTEEERRRLAADLHDQVLPELRQIAAQAERLKHCPGDIASELEHLEAELRGAMNSVREVMEALRPSVLDMLGLGDALESALRTGAARCAPPLAVTVRRVGEEPTLTADQRLALYRICQEAIHNLFQHSGARHAGLEVQHADGALILVIWDDGCGLDLEQAAGVPKAFGMANIRYRADLIGARVRWSARETGGTRVEVCLPLRETPADSVDN